MEGLNTEVEKKDCTTCAYSKTNNGVCPDEQKLTKCGNETPDWKDIRKI